MKHYQKPDGSVWAFEADGSQDHLVTPGMTAITAEQAKALTARAPDPVAVLIDALQKHMDAAAQALGYDDLKTAITYRGDNNPKFAAEAEGFFAWRSAVWTESYARLAAGGPLPTVAEALAAMPALVIGGVA